MRLIDLNPHWVGIAPGHVVGFTFLCPCCHRVRLGVAFELPIGDHPEYVGPDLSFGCWKGRVWKREGDTFENLTLSPSIDASGFGHWHGHIQNGEIV